MIDGGEFASSGPELRSIQHRVTVSAERAAVFAAFTTTEGLKAFLQVEARVELRVGGAYELYFAEAGEAPRGQRGSEGCKILGYLPGQMLCFSWNAPPHLPEEREQHTWVVLRLRDAGPGRTRVSLTHTGFGRGGRWDEVIAYFEMAWAKVLAALGAHFGTAPPGVRMQSLILAVTNLERSVRFYEAAFAWPRRIDVPVLVELALPDGGGLALYERGGFAVNTRQAPETVPAGAIAGTEIYLRCEDLDAAIAGLEAAGARPLSARAPRDWGDEAAYYADPDGNVVAVSRPLR